MGALGCSRAPEAGASPPVYGLLASSVKMAVKKNSAVSDAGLRRLGEQATRRLPGSIRLARHQEQRRPHFVVLVDQRHHHADLVALARGGAEFDAAMAIDGAVFFLELAEENIGRDESLLLFWF